MSQAGPSGVNVSELCNVITDIDLNCDSDSEYGSEGSFMPDGEILHYPDESSDSEGDGDDTDNHVDMEVLHEGTTPEPTVSPPERAQNASLPAVDICEDMGTVHCEPLVADADHTDSQANYPFKISR